MVDEIKGNNGNLPKNSSTVGGKMPDITGKLTNLIEKDMVKTSDDSVFCYTKDGKLDAVIYNNTIEKGGAAATIFEKDKTIYAWDFNCDGTCEKVIILDKKEGGTKYTGDANGNIESQNKM